MDALDSKEIIRDSLVVVGNGFDLAHGLKTSFTDFRSWLINHDQGRFLQSMEDIFYGLYDADKNKLWSEFESALGKVDIDDIHLEYQEIFKGKDVFDDIIEPTVLFIGMNFTAWIKDINTQFVKPKLSLPKDALYLSFNYTDTLESVYGIPQKQICHIHGWEKGDTELVYGCKDNPIPFSLLDKEEKDCIQYLVRYKCAEFLKDALKKNTTKHINDHHTFFESIESVKNVFVIGHSLAEVDWPYFLEIHKHSSKESTWHITYHNYQDKIKLQSCLLLTKLKNVQLTVF